MRALRVALAVAAAGTVTVTGLAVAGSHPEPGSIPRAKLAELRQATVAYHDVDAAIADGYELLDVCFKDEAAGEGMGYHYWVGEENLDGEVDEMAPEALVYEPNKEGTGPGKLVAVEYIVPASLVNENDPPVVLGQTMHQPEGLPLYVLHAWIWEANPDGIFEDYSSNVPVC